jgi:hypothetical protein
MIEYCTNFYEWHGEGASQHNLSNLDDMLNKYAAEGWTLFDLKPISIGYLAIFERAKAVK